jgi:HAD superfamily hydrolase (TIGR01509 family)
LNYDLIIFDCDGVLVDSEPIANKILRDALSKNGLEMTTEKVIQKFVGRSMSSVISMSEELLGKKLPHNFLKVLQVQTFLAFKKNLKAIHKVESVIIELKRYDTKICIASSGSFDKINYTLGLTGLRHYFDDYIFNSSQVPRGKPYPDIYLYAADQMEVEPAKCLVIEDSLPGVQGAVAAGMEVIAYSVLGEDENLRKAGGLVFSQMDEILKHIL